MIYRSIDKTCDSIARYSKADAACYRRVHDDFALMKDGFLKAFFSPPSPPSTMARALETSHAGLRRLQEFSLSARAWVEMNFEHDFVKAVMLNWALAPQILPDQEGAGQSFYIMIPAIHVYGQAIPRAAARSCPTRWRAMSRRMAARSSPAARSQKFWWTTTRRAVCASMMAARSPRDGRWYPRWSPDRPSCELVGERKLAPDFIDMVRKFSFGQISVCRLQLALREPPRFLNGAEMSACLFHRIVDSTEQMRRFYAELAMGRAAR